ncbi:hypothetical protein ACFY3U_01735 [Micromonospora sp. NPDC000089]|uniref:hypothetical protein n=1 Tax=unclassified Micromonospora TaxID=2617518 RepID=UPI0036C4B340
MIIWNAERWDSDGDIPTPVDGLQRLRAAFPGYKVVVAGDLATRPSLQPTAWAAPFSPELPRMVAVITSTCHTLRPARQNHAKQHQN